MRGPLRTITVLRALNVRNGSNVGDLAKATGISRPALYRILETLREAGYVSVDLRGQRYCLTILVRTLAEGFSDEDWVVQVARPVLRALQKKVLWPVDLGTFLNNAMWIRESTRQASPLTVDRGVVGVRFPMLRGATGICYLAFCPDAERELILSNLLRSREPGDDPVDTPDSLNKLFNETRARGYGLRYGKPPLETGAISVPVLLDGQVLGCIALTFMAGVDDPAGIARQHLGALNEAALQIADGVRRLGIAAGNQTQHGDTNE